MSDLPELSRSIRVQGVRRPLLALLCLGFLLCGLSMPAISQTASEPSGPASTLSNLQLLPVWEFGVGAGHYAGFDYPASDDGNRRTVALPFFIYRGPRWRLGGGGLSAVAIEQPRVRLDLSIGGSLNASSAGNRARAGMPDLDFLFEIGPQIQVSLLQREMSRGGSLQIQFSAELRAVLSTDFRQVRARGAVIEAGFGGVYRDFRRSGIDLLASVKTSLASERLQDYFYEVGEEHATSVRPSFDARAGYLETGVFAGVGLSPMDKVRLFAGVFTDWFEGARNDDSPLFETDSSTGFAIGVIWTLKQSRERVGVVDMG